MQNVISHTIPANEHSVNSFLLSDTNVKGSFAFRSSVLSHISKIEKVSVILDASWTMGAFTDWREQYAQLTQILGDDVQVMHCNADGVFIHDNKNADTIYRMVTNSPPANFKFALELCRHDTVIILSHGITTAIEQQTSDKFIIYWNVQYASDLTNAYHHTSLSWVNKVVDWTTAHSDHAQLQQIETAVFINQLKLSMDSGKLEFKLDDYGPRGT